MSAWKALLATLIVGISGCSATGGGGGSQESQDQGSTQVFNQDKLILDQYPKVVQSTHTEDQAKAAALLDYQYAANFCVKVHNYYERNEKLAESKRLGLGLSGGFFGAIGAMLATAGTGGYFGGVSSAIASVSSTTLGSAEKGPVGPAAFAVNRQLVAKAISVSAAKLSYESKAAEIYMNAVSLYSSCPVPLGS